MVMFWRRVLRIHIVFIVLAVLVVFPGGCSDNTSDAEFFGPELASMLAEAVKELDAPGACIALKFADGSIFEDAAGYADTGTREVLTTDHYFRIGSTTKTFTAAAILTLYDQGLLSLDDSVESLLPGVMSDYGDEITVRMLLNHTSGLNDYVGSPYEDSYFFYILVDNPGRIWEPEELVAMAVDEGLAAEPGEAFLYSNTNYVLLGLILENITGKSVEEYFRETFLDPLGLSHTLMPLDSGMPDRYAHGYFETDSDGILYEYSIQSPTAFWTAGSLISTPGDLLIWLEALLEGRFLTEDAWNRQHEFVAMAEGSDDGYGLGIFRSRGDIGHNGSVLGYQTQMFESNGVYIVVYSNCYYQTRENVSKEIFDRTKEILLMYK